MEQTTIINVRVTLGAGHAIDKGLTDDICHDIADAMQEAMPNNWLPDCEIWAEEVWTG